MVRQNYRNSLLLSVLIHALFFLCFAWLMHRSASIVPPSPRTWIEVLAPAEEPVRKQDERNTKTRNQIVQTEVGKRTQVAPREAFLGEKNQEVDRETVSRRKMTVMGSKAGSPAEAKPKPQVAAVPQISALGLPILKRITELNQELEENSQKPEWATPGVRPEDYSKGIAESDRTALNTKEYAFYGYFQRIRERLDRAWLPILKENLVKFYRGGRHLASDMEHVTKVMVVLNAEGEITRVKLLSESGTRDLDEAAVKAFNRAGPFPNPPRGMIDPNGEIQVPWEFILRT